MRILLNESTCRDINHIAKGLLIKYTEDCPKLFGNEYTSYNPHGLIHLADDALQFGQLNRVSVFPFENYLGSLKRVIRKPGAKLEQIIKRTIELQRNQISCPLSSTVEAQKFKDDYPKGHRLGHIKGKPYKRLFASGNKFSICRPNNCVILDDGNIFKIKNIVKSFSGETILLGSCFSKIENLYDLDVPRCEQFESGIFSSASLDVFLVSKLKSELISIPFSAIKCKAVSFPDVNGSIPDSFAIFRLHIKSNE